jgi:hypothetical protein
VLLMLSSAMLTLALYRFDFVSGPRSTQVPPAPTP